jgi:ribosomal protein S6--L-glutamate ligase
MRLLFLLARRNPPQPSQIVLEASEILTSRGARVETVIAEEALLRPDLWVGGRDLHLLKSYTDLSLALGGVLHARGARLLNPYPACVTARNKILCAQVLTDAGIPAPRTWVTGELSQLRSLLRETPIIVKPFMGWRGQGVRAVRTVADLEALPPLDGAVVVQELLDGPGEDLRVYVAGERMFATKKPFSATSFAVPGRPVPVSSEVGETALRVGRAFGLGLYGMDFIETPNGPRVVDVNYFPGYKGCAGAAEAVASYIEGCASGKIAMPRSTLRSPRAELDAPKPDAALAAGGVVA